MLKPVVIKVGGALIDDKVAASTLFQYIAELSQTRAVVMVHGGGPLVETLMRDLGLASHKLNGLRVTPDEHMPYICGALAGTANKKLCGVAISTGLNVVGLSLLDGGMLSCTETAPELGAVGTPLPGKPDLLETLLSKGYLPVISSIGSDENGRLLNVNADTAATLIAQLLNADLLLLSNVPGVLDGEKQRLSSLDDNQIDTLKRQDVIKDGMAVKVDAALEAAKTMAHPVTIASWAEDLSLILSGQSGTRILP